MIYILYSGERRTKPKIFHSWSQPFYLISTLWHTRNTLLICFTKLKTKISFTNLNTCNTSSIVAPYPFYLIMFVILYISLLLTYSSLVLKAHSNMCAINKKYIYHNYLFKKFFLWILWIKFYYSVDNRTRNKNDRSREEYVEVGS